MPRPKSGALAKAASGALDHVPLIRVVNLARAIETVKRAGFWCVGLAAEAELTLPRPSSPAASPWCWGPKAAGLRRLTREHCDQLVRLPTSGPIAQLNVSNAAAVALYELARMTPSASSPPSDIKMKISSGLRLCRADCSCRLCRLEQPAAFADMSAKEIASPMVQDP